MFLGNVLDESKRLLMRGTGSSARERNCYLLERARSDQTLSDASSAPRVHVRPIYDDGGLRRISHGVRRMDKNVRRVCLYRVDV